MAFNIACIVSVIFTPVSPVMHIENSVSRQACLRTAKNKFNSGLEMSGAFSLDFQGD